VLGDTPQHETGQIEPLVLRVGAFKLMQHSYALQVVLESAARLREALSRQLPSEVVAAGRNVLERVLSCMSEGCMSHVVTQRNGFSQPGVEPQHVRQSLRDLSDLHCVSQACSNERVSSG
jgi:hypothetical protein